MHPLRIPSAGSSLLRAVPRDDEAPLESRSGERRLAWQHVQSFQPPVRSRATHRLDAASLRSSLFECDRPLASPSRSRSTPRQVCVVSAFTSFRPYTVRDSSSLPTGPIQGFPPPDRPRLLRLSSSSEQLLIVAPACARDASSPHHCVSQPFFEGNGPARQGLCGLDFWPCLSSELSSPSVPLAAARARHTRQRLSCGPEATAAL